MKKRDTAVFQFMGWDLNKVFPFNLEIQELGFDNIQKLETNKKLVLLKL